MRVSTRLLVAQVMIFLSVDQAVETELRTSNQVRTWDLEAVYQVQLQHQLHPQHRIFWNVGFSLDGILLICFSIA
jgi:hypothetical protein